MGVPAKGVGVAVSLRAGVRIGTYPAGGCRIYKRRTALVTGKNSTPSHVILGNINYNYNRSSSILLKQTTLNANSTIAYARQMLKDR